MHTGDHYISCTLGAPVAAARTHETPHSMGRLAQMRRLDEARRVRFSHSSIHRRFRSIKPAAYQRPGG